MLCINSSQVILGIVKAIKSITKCDVSDQLSILVLDSHLSPLMVPSTINRSLSLSALRT